MLPRSVPWEPASAPRWTCLGWASRQTDDHGHCIIIDDRSHTVWVWAVLWQCGRRWGQQTKVGIRWFTKRVSDTRFVLLIIYLLQFWFLGFLSISTKNRVLNLSTRVIYGVTYGNTNTICFSSDNHSRLSFIKKGVSSLDTPKMAEKI